MRGTGIFTCVCVGHLFQGDVARSSEMQFCMVDHETGSSTQPHTGEWTPEFCPCFFIFQNTHNTEFIFLPVVIAVSCVKSDQLAGGRRLFSSWGCLWLRQPSLLFHLVPDQHKSEMSM
jgi:hypothetical protein